MGLRPYPTIFFYLILKFRAALTLSPPRFPYSLSTLFLFSVLFFTLSMELLNWCVSMCACGWMTGQGLWTLRPGWRIERPLEALWKPLQPVLTPSRGKGAGEERSKPERGGQEVDMKQKIRGASTVQESICGLCRISKRVSAVSKKGIKLSSSTVSCCKKLLQKENWLKHSPEGLCQAQWHLVSVMVRKLWKILCSKYFQKPVEFLSLESLWRAQKKLLWKGS